MIEEIDFEGYKEKLTYIRSNVENLVNHLTVKNHEDRYYVQKLFKDISFRLSHTIVEIMCLENSFNSQHERGEDNVFMHLFQSINSNIDNTCQDLYTLQKKLRINFEYLRDELSKIKVEISRYQK